MASLSDQKVEIDKVDTVLKVGDPNSNNFRVIQIAHSDTTATAYASYFTNGQPNGCLL